MFRYIRYAFLAWILISAYTVYNAITKYDANNPNSLNSMLMIIPSNQQATFLRNFNLLSEDVRSTNLHGRTRDEINQLANKYREHLRKNNLYVK